MALLVFLAGAAGAGVVAADAVLVGDDTGLDVRRQWTRTGELTPPKTPKAIRRIPLSPSMVIFLPRKLEEVMAEMELSYANRAEEDIQSTRFKVVPRGGGFGVIVESQIGH